MAERLVSAEKCPCSRCAVRPCASPGVCGDFALWLSKTVDAVEVVRCRDCKYSYCNKYCTNEQWKDDGCATVTIEADDFCSYGERKDNG